MASASYQQTAEEFRPAKVITSTATPTQVEVLTHPARFKAVVATRKWGKSTCGMLHVMATVAKPKRGGLFQWIAPTYRQARGPFRTLYGALRGAGQVIAHDAQAMTIDLATGWRVDFRSAEVDDNLRGDGPHAAIIDEIAQIKDETYDEVIRPSFSATGASCMFLGTPKGRRGVGWRIWSRGQPDPITKQSRDPLYRSWRFTCYDATFIPRAEWEEAKRTTSARAFAQEFMAEFLETEGVVFEEVRKRRATPILGEPVGIGADWAKDQDFTWFVAVGARSGAVLKVQRLPHRINYLQQVNALVEFCREFEGRGFFCCHDKTGVGNAVDDIMLQRDDRFFNEYNLESFLFTHKTKNEIVDEAIVDFESGRLGFIASMLDEPIYNTLIKEHEEFALEVSNTGKITYGAPDGFHDDAVMATILANRARARVAQGEMEFAPAVSFL